MAVEIGHPTPTGPPSDLIPGPLSTLRKRLSAGLPIEEKHFTDWCKHRVNGVLVESKGLLRRRRAEWTLFATGQFREG